jgi:hypothetical protein
MSLSCGTSPVPDFILRGLGSRKAPRLPDDTPIPGSAGQPSNLIKDVHVQGFWREQWVLCGSSPAY